MTEGPKRVRRDPRAERSARAPGEAPPVAAPADRTIVVEDPAFLVLAVPDLADGRLSAHDRDVLGAARSLADAGGGGVTVLAFAAGPDFAATGADRLVLIPATGPEHRAAAVLAAVAALDPRHVLFPDTLTAGGNVGRRVAARLGDRAAGNVHSVAPDRVVRRARGGAEDIVRTPPRVLLLAPEAADPYMGPRREARPLPVIADLPVARIRDDGRVPVAALAMPLADADFIVAAGNGVTDWAAFHRVAAALGATLGGSRVACDAGHLPRDRQVGVSGTMVEPRCYLAFGIAGANQHLQGIARCERVIAVNTDLHADFIKRADLGIVADAQAVMPALADLAERKRGDD